MPGSTPVYGFPYPEPTDLVADYPALGQNLAEDIEAVLPTIGGLAPVSPTSIANSGGSATNTAGLVTFTSVTSISLNGVFTASYRNYFVTYDITGASTASSAELYMRLRASGTDLTTTYLGQRLYAGGASVTGATDLTTGWHVGFVTSGGTSRSAAQTFIYRPQLAQTKAYTTHAAGFSSISYVDLYAGFVTTASAYDGLTLYPTADNISGTIRVYGLKA